MRGARGSVAALVVMLVADVVVGQPGPASATPQDCGSVVMVRCDKPPAFSSDPTKQDAKRRAEARRAQPGPVELDRIIIEGDPELRDTPEQAINRALSRSLQREGEHSFAIGESAQCTCRNICPPPPLPCCACTDRVGSRLSTAPGWKPMD